MVYPNGEVPLRLLVKDGENYFFPNTHHKWIRLRDAVEKRTGVRLYITPPAHGGANAYRDLAGQHSLRDALGIQASVPGRSSHGGRWTGRTTGRYGLPVTVVDRVSGAIDVGNFSAVPWEVFVEEAEAAGFLVDVVVPKELWHLVDLDPWGGSPATTNQEDTMPTPENKATSARQKLSKGKYHPIQLQPKAVHEFAMTGAGEQERGSIVLDIRLDGGPNSGTLGRVRAFFEEKRADGRWHRIKTRMDIEIPATTGRTTFQYSDKYSFGGKNPTRARVEVQADHEGVFIVNTDYRKEYWRP